MRWIPSWLKNGLGRLSGKRAASPSSRSAAVGKWGEDAATRFLEARGFRIVGRNLRPDRHDELDLIARQGEWLVFVEVKTRKRDDFARPIRSIDRKKKHALNRAAAAYLRTVHYPELYYRFDVVEVVGAPESSDPPAITHTENAFPFESRFRFPV